MLPETISLVLTAATANAAVANATSGSPWDLLSQYGILGLVVLGFMTQQLVPGVAHRALEAENKRLSAMVQEKLFPIIESSNAAVDRNVAIVPEAVKSLHEVTQELRASRELFERLSREGTR